MSVTSQRNNNADKAAGEAAKEIAMLSLVPKHPRAIRLMHWINVPVLTIMIWSGLLIYWANDVYDVRVGSVTLFHFFPDWFYEMLGLGHRLATGMSYHFVFMWIFAIN